MAEKYNIKSVAIIGAGASGAITAAAFQAENYFTKIKVFERRETAGGTWNYDPATSPNLPLRSGSLPIELDPPLEIPQGLPKIASPVTKERYAQTPVYSSLTTNVPAIAMSFSDTSFAYGPFVPHYIPRQYVENYFSIHGTDKLLSLSTTVEDVSKIETSKPGQERWKLTLRKHDLICKVDIWWEEEFDAVILGNGHYSIPYIPFVPGLNEYMTLFPGRIQHSKTYRTPNPYTNKKILTIGNSASGHDVTADLITTATLPVYQSRRSQSRWEGTSPPDGIEWKPMIKEFLPSGRIIFDDGTFFDDTDVVIYCTGYKPSFPFWNVKNNGRGLWDYERGKLIKSYIHTFFQDFETLAIVGMPRVLTFRSFEYQAIALARLWSGRNTKPLASLEKQVKWEEARTKEKAISGGKFHDIAWETGETFGWLRELYEIAGLPKLTGEGRAPPVLGADVRWAVENLRKYPEPGKGKGAENGLKSAENQELGKKVEEHVVGEEGAKWVIVETAKKDITAFI